MSRKIAVVLAASLAVLFIAACNPPSAGTGVGVSGSGALVAIPTYRTGGVWVGQQSAAKWLWLPAAAAAGKALQLTMAEGVIGNAGAGTGYGSVGYVPFARTKQCHDPAHGSYVVEKWMTGFNNMSLRRLFVTCDFLRSVWERFPKLSGHKILACLTWLLARGGAGVPWGRAGGGVWSSDTGKVVVTSDNGVIRVAGPADGNWETCAEGGT